MSTLGLCYTKRVGTVQQQGLDFNSLCKLNDGTVLGSNSAGTFILDSGDDDNGIVITSFVEFATTDLGLANQKRIREAIVSMETSGTLQLDITADENSSITRYINADIDSQKQEGVVASVGRELKGRFFKVKISNTLGCDFSLDSIDLMIMLLTRKAGRVHFFKPVVVLSLPSITCEGETT